jgi:hypothetical protein
MYSKIVALEEDISILGPDTLIRYKHITLDQQTTINLLK